MFGLERFNKIFHTFRQPVQRDVTAFISWARGHAVTFDPLDGLNADIEKLSFLDGILENKRVVYLGEEDHWIHEKTDYRAQRQIYQRAGQFKCHSCRGWVKLHPSDCRSAIAGKNHGHCRLIQRRLPDSHSPAGRCGFLYPGSQPAQGYLNRRERLTAPLCVGLECPRTNSNFSKACVGKPFRQYKTACVKKTWGVRYSVTPSSCTHPPI